MITDDIISKIEKIAQMCRDSYRYNYKKAFTFRDNFIYFQNVTPTGIIYWHSGHYNKDGDWVNGKNVTVLFSEMTAEELQLVVTFANTHYPREYTILRDRYLIKFIHPTTKEELHVNLKDKKFTKVYKTGRERDIKFPHSFFKGMDGRIIAKQIPATDHFKTLVDTIIKREYKCSSFGTFLIRLLDNIHLETYITANVPFDSHIKVGYDFFDKNIRDILNQNNIRYDSTVERFFGNDKDLARAVLHYIKDVPDFTSKFRAICVQMRDLTNLVNNYKYDLKTLFNYCEARNWSTARYAYLRGDLLQFMCDYARMAELVFPNGFDKYPEDIVDHHNGVQRLYEKEKIKFDELKFAGIIDKSYEWKNKDYSIIYPASTTSIQEEGRILSHCVGGYINNILSGSTVILFMRKNDELHSPLVTVEVRDNRIQQARGKYNRALTYEEKVFLEEYSEKKKLPLTQFVR